MREATLRLAPFCHRIYLRGRGGCLGSPQVFRNELACTFKAPELEASRRQDKRSSASPGSLFSPVASSPPLLTTYSRKDSTLIKTRARCRSGSQNRLQAGLHVVTSASPTSPLSQRTTLAASLNPPVRNVHHDCTFYRLFIGATTCSGALRPIKDDVYPSPSFTLAIASLCSYLSSFLAHSLSLSSSSSSPLHAPLFSPTPPMVAVKLTVLTLLASALGASAFPHLAKDLKGRDLHELERTVNDIIKRADIKKLHADARERHRTKRAATFSAETQLVDVTGEHRFIAPTSTSTRGPCPGLNVLANHGCEYFLTLDSLLPLTGLYLQTLIAPGTPILFRVPMRWSISSQWASTRL